MTAAKRYRRTVVVTTCPACGEKDAAPVLCSDCGIGICTECGMKVSKNTDWLCSLCYDEATENPWDVDTLR